MLGFLTGRRKRVREDDNDCIITNEKQVPLLQQQERRTKRQKMSEEQKRKNTIRQRLYNEVKKEIKPIALGSLAMIGSTLSNQAVPRLLGKLLDQKTTTTTACVAMDSCPNPAATTTPISSFLLVIFGGGLASFLRTILLDQSQDAIAARLRSQAFHSLLTKQDLEWFQKEKKEEVTTTNDNDNDVDMKDNDDDVVMKDAKDNETTKKQKHNMNNNSSPVGMTTGAIGNILQEDVSLVAKSITTTLANLLRSSASMLFGSYHMIRLNPTLFGLSVTVVPLIGAAAIIVRKQVSKLAKQQRNVATLAAAFSEERLHHLQFVKMSNREQDEVDTFEQMQQDVVQYGRSLSYANGTFMGFIFAASSSALLWVFDVGGKSVAAGKMTAGDLTSFATYTFLLGLGTSGVLRAANEFTQGMVSANRVYDIILSEEEEETEKEEKAKQSPTRTIINDVETIDSIELQNVSFAYQTNPTKMVLKNINLKLQRGKVTCLVGKNGSGKSTLAMLLAALYKPTTTDDSKIQLSNGINYIQELDRAEQKKIVQVVPQQPALFNTSIFENVRYTKPNATKDEVWDALKCANCVEFVSKLSGDDIYAQVGTNGSKLSGGQRQRIGIARALLHPRPLLLVLDEPTSALDAEGEEAVSNAIEESCRRHKKIDSSSSSAVLLITHRAKSLELADEIIVLSEGEIVERGTLANLKSNPNSELSKLLPTIQEA